LLAHGEHGKHDFLTMKFFLCFIASSIGFVAVIYWFTLAATIWIRDWKALKSAIIITLIHSCLYAFAWHYLPLQNWLILPLSLGAIAGLLVFYATVKNGHI
jgi:hypothetical protein